MRTNLQPLYARFQFLPPLYFLPNYPTYNCPTTQNPFFGDSTKIPIQIIVNFVVCGLVQHNSINHEKEKDTAPVLTFLTVDLYPLYTFLGISLPRLGWEY